jgi:hypothetical protein
MKSRFYVKIRLSGARPAIPIMYSEESYDEEYMMICAAVDVGMKLTNNPAEPWKF